MGAEQSNATWQAEPCISTYLCAECDQEFSADPGSGGFFEFEFYCVECVKEETDTFIVASQNKH